ncbi:hypothetical protein DBV15_11250, partial [Temnothorax longispinosus]
MAGYNKVFGEDKWSHAVMSQILDIYFVEYKYRFSCVSFVKVQLENGDCYQDVGYSYIAEESTKDSSIYSARVGSAINALIRVLLPFGDKIERELQQLQRQIINTFDTADSMDLEADFPDLISAANKVFGEGKWSYTIVNQTLDFIDYKCRVGYVNFVKVQLENGKDYENVGSYIAEESTKSLSIRNARIGSAVNALKRVLLSFGDKIERELQQQRQISFEQSDIQRDVAQIDGTRNSPSNYRAGCVSFVNVQLENGNFHKDVGYCNAEEFTKGLSIYNAGIGSAVNALKRVLLSFGDKIERELQQLQRQIINMFATTYPMDLAVDFPDLISAANKVFGEGKWSHTVVQILDFVDRNDAAINSPGNYRAGCVSFVNVQLENGNFHEDVGYYNTEEITESLSIHKVRITKLKESCGNCKNRLFLNKIFGEGKWRYTVVYQKLDFFDIRARDEYRAACVSSVKVQLENGNFHQDIGCCNAEEPTKGLSIVNARI